MDQFKFSVMVRNLMDTRCKPWDNRELDAFEGYKYMSTILTMINATAFYFMTTSIEDPWAIIDFFKMIAIAFTVSANIANESFYTISSFLGAYQCFMILKANKEVEGRKYFSFKDIMKIYARKYFRLAPFYYFFLFFGWSSCSRISNGPIWDIMNNDFYNCD